MLYLTDFMFPSCDVENGFFLGERRTCFDTFYPFKIIARENFTKLDFEPITILYGGNGSGKTTMLNVIAESLKLKRYSAYNRSNFFETYVKLCLFNRTKERDSDSQIITSDDVFQHMLKVRDINSNIDDEREDIFDEFSEYRVNNLEDLGMRNVSVVENLDKFRDINDAKRKSSSMSKYTRRRVDKNIREHSNGESALMYFCDRITESSLYLLDEPENSLSPQKQEELKAYIEDSARFYDCQFIIATHSPFLLATKNAKIYDLDDEVIEAKKWTQLPNVRAYYDFFKRYESEFD